jgi:hypothetical protein
MKNKKTTVFRNLAAFCLMLAVILSSSMITLAKTDKSLAGEIIVSGRTLDGNEPFVLLNGEKAFTGRTFFSSGLITTSETATATIRLGKLGHLTLTPNSSLSLSFSENRISGTLISGNVEVFNSEGVEVNIEKTENSAVNTKKQTQSSGIMNSNLFIPVAIFLAVVATAVIYSVTNGGDDNNVSPTR